MSITFVSPDSPARDSRLRKVSTIVFLDCPIEQRAAFDRAMAAAGVKVVWADSAAAVMADGRLRELPVLIGFSRGAGALKWIAELRTHNVPGPLFAVIDVDRPDLATEAVLAGVADVLMPDVTGPRLAAAIARERREPVSEGAASVTGLHDFYRHSYAMREACEAMSRVPAARSSVLIRGEAGTGRELAARALHAATTSARAGAFVSVDCAAFEPQQLDTELFGVSARAEEDGLPARGLERISTAGRLYSAIGGTLYLENVADASTRVQRRLARVLRDREVVVDGTPVSLDVRCMTGVDHSIATAIQDGRLDENLYRRLSATRVDLPALRNRREDIPALANRFLRDACAARKVPVKALSRSALALFAALPWRGNATELRELVELIVSRSTRGGIGVEEVLVHVRLDTGTVTVQEGGTLRQARTRFEHEYIAGVLRQHRGRITQAAKTLGIQRTNLYRKMRTLKVAQPRVR